jgi:hypothetical protein
MSARGAGLRGLDLEKKYRRRRRAGQRAAAVMDSFA